MKKIAIYDASGQIDRIVTCPDDMASLQSSPPGGGSVEVSDEIASNMLNWYMHAGSMIERPTMSASLSAVAVAANNTDIITLTAPIGARVFVDGIQRALVDADGSIDLTFSAPGDYAIRVELWPFKAAAFVIEAS